MQITTHISTIIILILTLTISTAQSNTELDTDTTVISYKCTDRALEEVLSDIQEIVEVKFQYNPSDLKDINTSINVEGEDLKTFLEQLLTDTSLDYKIKSDQVIIYKSKKGLGSTNEIQKHTISGYVLDTETTESLIGATVFAKESSKGTVTNEYGFFSITLPEGVHTIEASYLGYNSNTQTYDLTENQSVELQLSSGAVIEEVVITAESSVKPVHQRTQMSQFTLPVEKLKSIPVILGEEDLMKSMQLLPGVKSGSEGTSGIFVRGGSEDQNLILLDGVPVYNPSHVLGLFSVFNADAIKSVTLTKGGHPARYGGRLSSVVDIRMKEGNLEEWHGAGSIGLISSKLSVSGPIVKDKVSILLSARRTYADLIINAFYPQEGNQDVKPALFFHDYNGKIQYKINDKHRIYLSGYAGRDKFGASFSDSTSVQKSLINWGNKISALRWNYEISSKLFANTTVTYSDYEISTENSEENFIDTTLIASLYNSGITDLGAKIDFDYVPSTNHYIKFGASMVKHQYNPGINQNIQRKGETDGGNNRKVAGIEAVETDVYIEDDIKFGKFNANIGVHGSAFAVENTTYTSLQPRLGLRYLAADNMSIKASYSTMTQFINLLTSEALSLPSDVWVPSTNRIAPQESWQAALGIGGAKGQFEWEIEGYYKGLNNVLSYEEGTSLIDNDPDNWEDQITQGTGESYGMEVFLQKTKGKLTGWIGYTLSWSNRQFDDINNGEAFPFRYDRRHDISTVLSYAISDQIKLSANWVYNTGNAVTLPQYQYGAPIPGPGENTNVIIVQDGGEKNSFRMSPTHRLDWSISFTKKKKKYERTWIISFYNTYYRKNPFYLDLESVPVFSETPDEFGENFSGVTNVVREKSLIPIIPSFSYNIKF